MASHRNCPPYWNSRQFSDYHPTQKLVTSAPRAFFKPVFWIALKAWLPRCWWPNIVIIGNYSTFLLKLEVPWTVKKADCTWIWDHLVQISLFSNNGVTWNITSCYEIPTEGQEGEIRGRGFDEHCIRSFSWRKNFHKITRSSFLCILELLFSFKRNVFVV